MVWSDMSAPENKIIIKFKESMVSGAGMHSSANSPSSKNPDCGVDDIQLHFVGKSVGLSIFNVRDETTKHRIAEKLANCSEIIECVEEDMQLNLLATPNDVRFPEQWNLRQIGAEDAWNRSTGSQRVVVTVIDTGIDYNHPELWNNMWVNEGEIPGNGIDDDQNGYVDDYYGYDFKNEDGDPFDDHGHGTHIAGIIGAIGNNSRGISGINHHVKIMACKFMDKFGGGSLSDAVKCLDYSLQMGADITSNSYGHQRYSKCLDVALKKAENKGQLFVAASGNEGLDNDLFPTYPANYNHSVVISVGSSDEGDQLSPFSNFGNLTVDILAPGHNILSTVPGGFRSDTGTSMAVPHVAGAAALLLSASGGKLSGSQLKKILLESVDTVPDLKKVVSSGGRLNIARALELLKPPQIPVPLNFFDVVERRVPMLAGAAQMFNLRFNLDHASLIFSPRMSKQSDGSFYSVCRHPIPRAPADWTNGRKIDFKPGERSTRIALQGNAEFPFFGKPFGSLYVNPNGQITFGKAVLSYDPSLANHFNALRISALFSDLDPSSGGEVRWSQQDDRFVVAWRNVESHFYRGKNTFQVELFWNGAIRIQFLGVSAFNAVVGVSDGTYSPLFRETYFSETDQCEFLPEPPKLILPIDGLPDMFSGADGSPLSGNFSIRNEGGEHLDLVLRSEGWSWVGNLLLPHYWLNPVTSYKEIFATESEPCGMGYCAYFSIQSERLLLMGPASYSPRLISPLVPPFRLFCQASRTRLANNHFLMFTPDASAVRWPRSARNLTGQYQDEMALYWDINQVYARSPIDQSFNRLCTEVTPGKLGGDHNITVDFGLSSATFYVTGCGTISVNHAFGATPLHVHLGANSKLGGSESWWNDFKILTPASIFDKSGWEPHSRSTTHTPTKYQLPSRGLPATQNSKANEFWMEMDETRLDVPPLTRRTIQWRYNPKDMKFGRHMAFVYGVSNDPNIFQFSIPTSLTVLECSENDWDATVGAPQFSDLITSATTTPPSVAQDLTPARRDPARFADQWNSGRADGLFSFTLSFNVAVPSLHISHFYAENAMITAVSRLDSCKMFKVEGEIRQRDPWRFTNTTVTIAVGKRPILSAKGGAFPAPKPFSFVFDHRPVGELYATMPTASSALGAITSSTSVLLVLVFSEPVKQIASQSFTVIPPQAGKTGGALKITPIPTMPGYFNIMFEISESYFGGIEISLDVLPVDSAGQTGLPVSPILIRRVERALVETTAFRFVVGGD
ncbi:hypothetical protein BSKO_05960 [Bryopsis sp. KO-2023]|nr:hypothetical protein BSKO_05960 [Bryopsis sp. KO-2023]